MLTTTNCKSVTAQVAGGPQNKFGKVHVQCLAPQTKGKEKDHMGDWGVVDYFVFSTWFQFL